MAELPVFHNALTKADAELQTNSKQLFDFCPHFKSGKSLYERYVLYFQHAILDTVFHIFILDTVVTFINPINLFLLTQLEHFYGLDKENNQQLSGE